MMASWSFFGAGFFGPDYSWEGVLQLLLFIPMNTWMMSTYDGTLGAVAVCTLFLPLVGVLPLKGGQKEILKRVETVNGKNEID